jgi:hypothetical protein
VTLPIHATAGNHAGPRSGRGLEIYSTPACAVEALIRAEPLPPVCWEACGPETSAIALVLRAHGRRVVCTDITTDGIDFRDRTKAPSGAQAIVANPPFSLAADFVRHGLALVPKVVVLERIQFLESEDRADIIEGGDLARVLVFADRVPRMHRQGWNGKRSSPAMCLAWFVFERGYSLQPVLKRIRCRPQAMSAPATHLTVGQGGPM